MIIILPPLVYYIVDLPFQGIKKLGNSQTRSWVFFHHTRGSKWGWSKRIGRERERVLAVYVEFMTGRQCALILHHLWS